MEYVNTTDQNGLGGILTLSAGDFPGTRWTPKWYVPHFEKMLRDSSINQHYMQKPCATNYDCIKNVVKQYRFFLNEEL
jgi:uncharacterized protein YyaL (SSP411 family)